MLLSDSVGGAEASRNGFSNAEPGERDVQLRGHGAPRNGLLYRCNSAFGVAGAASPDRLRSGVGASRCAAEGCRCRGRFSAASSRPPRPSPIRRADRRDAPGGDRRAPSAHRGGGRRGVQILGLQEIFNGPYFCPSQDAHWYDIAEPVPGPTTELMAEYAKKYQMAMVVPVYEREQAGVYYNTAAVIDADGTLPRQVPQEPHPADQRASGRSTSSSRATSATRSSRPATRRSASTSATTATSPRARGCSASTAPRSSSTRRPRSPGSRSTCGSSSSRRTRWPTATSSARINRVGTEAPWNIGKFYGYVLLRRPRGSFLADRLARTRTSSSSPSWTST